jgi:thioredoxin-related protein
MKYLLLIFILFFSACSVKEYEITQTKIITIKSPKIKFSDAGYLRNSDKTIELELFMAGRSIEKISVNHMICTSEGCMSKSGFNKDYLHSSYPDDTMQNMLLSHAIYDGKNVTKTADGFEQKIKSSQVDIIYRVDSHGVFFKDRANGIIFSIKDIDE